MNKQKNLGGNNAAPEAPNFDKEEWEEIEDASFFQFEKPGDAVIGELIDKGTSERYGFGIYTLKKATGDTVRFHGSTQLDDLMLGINTGDTITVTFMDTQNLPNGTLKVFSVRRKK